MRTASKVVTFFTSVGKTLELKLSTWQSMFGMYLEDLFAQPDHGDDIAGALVRYVAAVRRQLELAELARTWTWRRQSKQEEAMTRLFCIAAVVLSFGCTQALALCNPGTKHCGNPTRNGIPKPCYKSVKGCGIDTGLGSQTKGGGVFSSGNSSGVGYRTGTSKQPVETVNPPTRRQ